MDRKRDSRRSYQRSNRLLGFSENDVSILFCKRSLTTKSDCYEAHYLWGRNLVIKQQNEKAARKFKELLIIDPEDWRSYFNLGVLSERRNNWIEAETQYNKSLSLCPSDIASNNLVLVLIMQWKLPEALEQSKKNIQTYSKDPVAHNLLGRVKFILGDYKGAIKSFEAAIGKLIQGNLAFLNKIIALHCMGKIEKAAEEFWGKFDKVRTKDLEQNRENLKIYEKELNHFEEILKIGDLKGMVKEILEKNIEGFRFLINLIKQNISKTCTGKSRRRLSGSFLDEPGSKKLL